MILRIGAVDRAMPVRYGMRGIAYITVEFVDGIGLRSFKGQRAIFPEKEIPGFCFFGWPRIERGPNVAAGLEQQRFLERLYSFVLQQIGEPRGFHLLAKKNCGVASKRYGSQCISRPVPPTAVIPWTHHQ